jgi:SnoaL-like domain
VNDALEILRLIGEYCHAIDERGGDGLADLFTEDGELDFMGELIRGRAAITDRLSGSGAAGLVHVPYNPALDIDGDTGTGTVDHMLLRRGDDGAFGVLLVGRWIDKYAHDWNRWRIASRRIDLPFGPPPGLPR